MTMAEPIHKLSILQCANAASVSSTTTVTAGHSLATPCHTAMSVRKSI